MDVRRSRTLVDHGGGTLSVRLVGSGGLGGNLRRLNAVAHAVFRRGHVPIVGVNLALPVIESAGQESYEQIMPALSLSLTERCDAILRIEGASQGADDEVEAFRARGLPVFRSVDEIPNVRPDTGDT